MRSEFAARPTVHSVNLSGALRQVPFAGQLVTTGFFKSAVNKPVRAHKLGLEGDAQADLSVHGGMEKAVYFYPGEHYAQWEDLLGTKPLPPGSFGENITSSGLLEAQMYIGDVLRIGTATLQVLQPRSPCHKLQLRFERPDMTALFFRQSRPGWYSSVLQEGTLSAGDEIFLIDRAQEEISVADVWNINASAEVSLEAITRMVRLKLLPDFWKRRVAHRAATALSAAPSKLIST